MKTKLLLIPILLIAGMAWGQEINTKTFTLDLQKPSITAENSGIRLVLRTKEPLAFKLINGNPYKYKYVINHKVVTFFENGVNPLTSENLNKMTTTTPKKNTLSTDENKIEEEISNTKSQIDSLQKDTSNLASLESKGQKSFKLNGKTFNTKNQLAFKKRELGLLKAKLEQLKAQQSALKTSSKSSFSTNYINSKTGSQLTTAKSEAEDKENIKTAYTLLQKEFENLNKNINNYILEISAEDFLDQDDFSKKRSHFNELYIEIKEDTKNISKEATNFPEVKTDFEKTVTEKINPISAKIKEELSKMYQLKFHNYLLPIDLNGKNIDAVEITVERLDKTLTNPTPDKYSYNIWMRGGLKIDISGGIFITSLMDKEYETKDSVTNKLIYEKTNGDYDFGFGSMINVSLRGGSWVRPALNFGALFTTNQKFQILSGLGLILGKEERIVIHGGLTMGRVSRVSGDYKTDGSVAYDLGTSGTVPTTDKFSFGHFIGVTYNFGKVKTQDNTKN